MNYATRVLAAMFAFALTSNARAEESLDALNKQRTAVRIKRRELQDKQRKISDKIDKSSAMSDAHEAVADAKREYEEALATSRPLKKAREAEAAAAAALKKIIAEKVADSKDIRTAQEERAELLDRRRRHRFEAGLVQRRLYARNSPLRAEARLDKLVHAAGKAVHKIEQDLRDDPGRAVLKARTKLEEARRRENERWRELQDSRKLKKAREKEREARDRLRQAESDDKRRAAAREARAAYNEARQEAYEDIRAARSFLKELGKIEEERTEINARIRLIDSLLNIHRAVLREDGSRAVRKAAKKVAAARNKYEKETDSKELRELHGKRKDTWAAAEGAEIAYMKSKEPDLMEKRDELSAERAELQKKLADGKSVSKDLLKVLTELQEVNSELGELHARHNAPDYGRLRGIWSGAKAAHVAALRADPDIVEAQDELDAARKELNAAVEEDLRESKAAEKFIEERSKLSDKLTLLDFEADIAKYQLYDRYSPLRQQVDNEKSVMKKRNKWQEIEKDIREDPTRAVKKAREAYEEARATTREIINDLKEDKSYAKALAARRSAEAALKAANAEDPRNKKLAEARKAYDNLLNRTIVALDKAQRILHEQKEIEKAREETESAIRAVDEKIRNTRRDLEQGDDKDIVKAGNALTQAQREVKQTENSGRLLQLRKVYEQARKAADAQLRKLLTDNKDHRVLETELHELAKQDRELRNRITVLARKARNAARNESKE